MGLSMPNHHTLWSVNVSDFAQNFRIHFLEYINGEIAIFFYFDDFKGFLFCPFKKNRFFHVLKFVKYMNFNDYKELFISW